MGDASALTNPLMCNARARAKNLRERKRFDFVLHKIKSKERGWKYGGRGRLLVGKRTRKGHMVGGGSLGQLG